MTGDDWWALWKVYVAGGMLLSMVMLWWAPRYTEDTPRQIIGTVTFAAILWPLIIFLYMINKVLHRG